jgi:hypothetical protein
MDDKDLTQGAHVKPPSGSYTLWENTMCNPLGDMRTQTQSAWLDGYGSAKVEREWVGLTDKDIENCLEMSIHGTCRAIEAKLKEKNA